MVPRTGFAKRIAEEFKKAHGRSGGGDLLLRHPQMSAYEIAVEREPESEDPV
jgi:hypothetical protein